MGKHREQAEKLEALRERLEAGELPESREIRHAIGADDYTAIYKKAQAELRAEAAAYEQSLAQMKERTDAQKEVERTIRTWLSLNSRVAEGKATQASADKQEERLGELFTELTHDERAQMNYWTVDEATRQIIACDDATTKKLPIYRDAGVGSKEDLKREALRRAIDEKIGRDEDDTETPTENENLLSQMTNLRKLTGD